VFNSSENLGSNGCVFPTHAIALISAANARLIKSPFVIVKGLWPHGEQSAKR